jgi:hypothetical protein
MDHDGAIFLAAMVFYASRHMIHSDHHAEKMDQMKHAVNEAKLLWAAMRAAHQEPDDHDTAWR